jgi:hypothetical protein
MSQTKTNLGNYFAGFSVGPVLHHPAPRMPPLARSR